VACLTGLVVLPCPICGRPIWLGWIVRTANGFSTEGTENGKKRAQRYLSAAHFVDFEGANRSEVPACGGQFSLRSG
jgi:hypothetical protein